MDLVMITCTLCKETKPACTDFLIDNKGYRNHRCKTCRKNLYKKKEIPRRKKMLGKPDCSKYDWGQPFGQKKEPGSF